MIRLIIAAQVAAITARFARLDLRMEAGGTVRLDSLDTVEIDHLTNKYGRRVVQTTRQGRKYITLR